MPPSTSEREPLDLVADDFLARYRRGERPSLSEYSERHPELAEDIRELFPALAMMEEVGKADSQGLPVPVRIGEFRILRAIGRGGMGIVYEAEEESLGRRVALKVLPLHGLMNPKQLERFRREARAAAALHHNHIVPVYSVGQSEGVHYYAMQFIDGPSLDKVIEQVRLASHLAGHSPALPEGGESGETPHGTDAHIASTAKDSGGLQTHGEREYYRRVAELGLETAEGLSYAHSQGIVHRDIKPSNLLIDQAGDVWITDFGLAKQEGPHELTHTGDVIGTLRYMAPEQLQGWADPRTDVHGLGLVLYELIALRPAYEGAARGELVRQISDHAPPLLKKFDRHVPRDLETIVAKALAREPADRYASAGDLAADLQRFLADHPVHARRTSLLERFRRWCGRNPVVAGLIATVAILLLSVAGVASAMNWQLQLSLTATASAERAKTDQLWRSRLNEVLAMRRTGRPGQRVEAWEKLREAVALAQELKAPEAARAELRSAAISTLALSDLSHAGPGPRGVPGVRNSLRAIDPTLTTYCRIDADQLLTWRYASDDSELSPLSSTKVSGMALPVEFSLDGRHLAQVVGFQLLVWEKESRELEFTAKLPEAKHKCSLSADGRRLACMNDNGLVTVYDLPTRSIFARILTRSGTWQIALCPAGNRLAASGPNLVDDAYVYDVPTGLRLGRLAQDQPQHVAWHPTGKLLAVSGSDFLIHVWNMSAWREQCVLRGHQALPRDMAFTGDGELIASTATDGTVRLWNAWTGREVVRCAGTVGSRLSSSGDQIAVRQGNGYELYNVFRSAEYRTLPLDSVMLFAKSNCILQPQHPQFGWLPVVGSREIRLLDPQSGEVLATASGSYTRCSWSADGRTLFTEGWGGARAWPISRAGLALPARGEPETAEIETAKNAGSLVIGPPQRIGPSGTRVAVHPAGRHVFVTGSGKVQRLGLPLNSTEPETVDTPYSLGMIISSDGRWLASTTSGKGSQGIVVQSAERNESAVVLGLDAERVWPRFAPGSRILAASADGLIRLWRVGKWTELREVATEGGLVPAYDFSPDGQYLAYARTPYQICLEDVETGKQRAVFEAPDDLQVEQIQFDQSGRRLFVGTEYPPTLRVWDLSLVGKKLASLGLDEGFPTWVKEPVYRPSPRAVFNQGLSKSALRLEVQKSHDVLAFRDVAALLESVLETEPEDTEALTQLAWLLAAGPSDIRDPERAEILARQSCNLNPNQSLAWNALGAALLRLGRPDDALPVLFEAERARLYPFQGGSVRQWDSINGFLIALAQHQLGIQETGTPTTFAKASATFSQRGKSLEPWVAFYTAALRIEVGLAMGQLPLPSSKAPGKAVPAESAPSRPASERPAQAKGE